MLAGQFDAIFAFFARVEADVADRFFVRLFLWQICDVLFGAASRCLTLSLLALAHASEELIEYTLSARSW